MYLVIQPDVNLLFIEIHAKLRNFRYLDEVTEIQSLYKLNLTLQYQKFGINSDIYRISQNFKYCQQQEYIADA